MKQYDIPRQETLLPRLERARPATPTVPGDAATTYYNRPMIKPPHWKWFIPFYFFIGGVAAGASFFGALAALFGGPRHRATVRHARYLSLALALICPVLLILDLGRPARFHHMLRVFKVSSPLSVGTWILALFGVTSGVLAARQAAEDNFVLKRESLLGRLARLAPNKPLAVLHGLLGLGLGGYTGTLLASTAVPLWAAAGVLLGPLFLAASVTSGAAALIVMGLLSGKQSRSARADLEVVATVGALTQFGLAAAHDLLVPEQINRPLRHGLWGRVFRYGAVGGGLIAPMGLRVCAWFSGPRLERALSFASAICTLLGALGERFSLVEAGKLSAKDPLAYQELTRGTPGDARSTPVQQARRVTNPRAFGPGVSARDTIGAGDPGVR